MWGMSVVSCRKTIIAVFRSGYVWLLLLLVAKRGTAVVHVRRFVVFCQGLDNNRLLKIV